MSNAINDTLMIDCPTCNATGKRTMGGILGMCIKCRGKGKVKSVNAPCDSKISKISSASVVVDSICETVSDIKPVPKTNSTIVDPATMGGNRVGENRVDAAPAQKNSEAKTTGAVEKKEELSPIMVAILDEPRMDKSVWEKKYKNILDSLPDVATRQSIRAERAKKALQARNRKKVNMMSSQEIEDV